MTATRDGRLSQQLFEAFDMDGDGFWTFADFRAYVDAMGRAESEFEPHVLSSLETWRCFVFDHFGCSDRGLLGLDHFVAYREAIEATYSIEVDALNAGIDAVPTKLVEWRKVLAAFDALDLEYHHPVAKRRKSHEEEEPPARALTGAVQAHLFQVLVARCGEVHTAEECGLALVWHLYKNRCMADLRQRHARRHIFEDPEASSVGHDATKLYRDAFVAWWFSDRLQPTVRAPRTRAALVAALAFRTLLSKARGRGSARVLGRASLSRLTQRLASVVNRGFLTAAAVGQLAAARERRAKVEFKVSVGGDARDLAVGDGGFGVEVDFGKIDKPKEFAMEYALPRDAGSTFVIDLSARSDATTEELKEARDQLADLIATYLEPDLKRTPHFDAAKVLLLLPKLQEKTTPQQEQQQQQQQQQQQGSSAVSATSLVRIQVTWRAPEGTFDAWVIGKSARLAGLSLADLVNGAVISARCSHSLQDILESTELAVGEDLSLRLQGHCAFAGAALARLGEEVLHAAADADQMRHAEVGEKAAAHDRAKGRTLATHGPLLRAGERPETGITAFEAPTVEDTEESLAFEGTYSAGLLRSLRWAVLRFARSAKTSLIDVTIDSLNQLLLENAVLLALLPSGFAARAKRIIAPDGGLALAYARWKSAVTQEMDDLDDEAEAVLDAEVRRADESERRHKEHWDSLTELDRQRAKFKQEKEDLEARLKAERNAKFGIAGESRPTEEQIDPVEHARELRAENAERLHDALQLYATLCRTIVSVERAVIASGKVRAICTFDSLNIFEVLP